MQSFWIERACIAKRSLAPILFVPQCAPILPTAGEPDARHNNSVQHCHAQFIVTEEEPFENLPLSARAVFSLPLRAFLFHPVLAYFYWPSSKPIREVFQLSITYNSIGTLCRYIRTWWQKSFHRYVRPLLNFLHFLSVISQNAASYIFGIRLDLQ